MMQADPSPLRLLFILLCSPAVPAPTLADIQDGLIAHCTLNDGTEKLPTTAWHNLAGVYDANAAIHPRNALRPLQGTSVRKSLTWRRQLCHSRHDAMGLRCDSTRLGVGPPVRSDLVAFGVSRLVLLEQTQST